MAIKEMDTQGDTVDSLSQGFENGIYYGLEYVLDELVNEQPKPANPNTVDWFGSSDYFA